MHKCRPQPKHKWMWIVRFWVMIVLTFAIFSSLGNFKQFLRRVFFILRSEKLRSNPAWFTDMLRSRIAKLASSETDGVWRKAFHIRRGLSLYISWVIGFCESILHDLHLSAGRFLCFFPSLRMHLSSLDRPWMTRKPPSPSSICSCSPSSECGTFGSRERTRRYV